MYEEISFTLQYLVRITLSFINEYNILLKLILFCSATSTLDLLFCAAHVPVAFR
jgi:hypothetical protein